LADEGYLHGREDTKPRLEKIKNLNVKTLPGYHHLHLDSPQAVAEEINQFLI